MADGLLLLFMSRNPLTITKVSALYLVFVAADKNINLAQKIIAVNLTRMFRTGPLGYDNSCDYVRVENNQVLSIELIEIQRDSKSMNSLQNDTDFLKLFRLPAVN